MIAHLKREVRLTYPFAIGGGGVWEGVDRTHWWWQLVVAFLRSAFFNENNLVSSLLSTGVIAVIIGVIIGWTNLSLVVSFCSSSGREATRGGGVRLRLKNFKDYKWGWWRWRWRRRWQWQWQWWRWSGRGAARGEGVRLRLKIIWRQWWLYRVKLQNCRSLSCS